MLFYSPCFQVVYAYESKMLLNVLDNAQKENYIQKYIKDNKKWFIPASIFEDYDFGHHEAYIVPEQALGSEYRVGLYVAWEKLNRISHCFC